METRLVPRPYLEQVARRFRLLGEPARLELLDLLHTHGEMNVQNLVAGTGQSQANVSKHLRLMMDEHMVDRRQEGLFVYYRIADPSLSGICLLVCSQVRARSDSVEL